MTCTSRSITAFVLMCLAALFWVIGVSTDSMASISSGGVKIVYGRLFPKHNQDTLRKYPIVTHIFVSKLRYFCRRASDDD